MSGLKQFMYMTVCSHRIHSINDSPPTHMHLHTGMRNTVVHITHTYNVRVHETEQLQNQKSTMTQCRRVLLNLVIQHDSLWGVMRHVNPVEIMYLLVTQYYYDSSKILFLCTFVSDVRVEPGSTGSWGVHDSRRGRVVALVGAIAWSTDREGEKEKRLHYAHGTVCTWYCSLSVCKTFYLQWNLW